MPLSLSPEERRRRARLAANTRWHGQNQAESEHFQRQAEIRRIDELITQIEAAAEAGRLTDDQWAKLRQAFPQGATA